MNKQYLKNLEFFSEINYLLFKAELYRAIVIIKAIPNKCLINR